MAYGQFRSDSIAKRSRVLVSFNIRLAPANTGAEWVKSFDSMRHGSSTQLGAQMMDDEWRRLSAEMTNEELEYRLFTYFWLAMKTPNSQSNRLRELVDEAERRGQAAMVERAKLRAADLSNNL